MTGIDPRRVPVSQADRAHAQCRDILDRLIATRPERDANADVVRVWLEDIKAVIDEVTAAPGAMEHYESILLGVAAVAVTRLGRAYNGGDR